MELVAFASPTISRSKLEVLVANTTLPAGVLIYLLWNCEENTIVKIDDKGDSNFVVNVYPLSGISTTW